MDMRTNLLLILLMLELNGCSIHGLFTSPPKRKWTSEVQVENHLVKIQQERSWARHIWIWPLHFHGGGWYPTGREDYYTLSRNEDLEMLEDYEDRGYTPIILNRYQGKLYMVLYKGYSVLKKEPYNKLFKVLRLHKGEWREIGLSEFPKQISYQNVNQWQMQENPLGYRSISFSKEGEMPLEMLNYRIDFVSELKKILKKTENESPNSTLKVFPSPWRSLDVFSFWLCMEYNDCNIKDLLTTLDNKAEGRLNLRFIRNYVKRNFPDEEAKPTNTPEVN